MREFKRFHPLINFIYFAFLIGYSCFLMHPLFLCISFVWSVIYSVMINGKKAVKNFFIYMLPLLFLTALINPLFNHQGITILTYFKNGNPLTLESVIYGVSSGIMIVSVIGWFSCYNEVMTSDKTICLFGRVIPTISLVFSMTLRFIPELKRSFNEIVKVRKCMGCNLTEGNIIKRAKNFSLILIAVLSRSLDRAIDISDSMKSRGYGNRKRTNYSVYKFTKKDTIFLLLVFVLGIIILTGIISGRISFNYFPEISEIKISGYEIFYLLLCMCPLIIEVKEGIKWKYLKSKI